MTSPVKSNQLREVWSSVAFCAVPPCAAAAAIVPVFRDMVAKSAQQKGESVPNTTILKGFKNGLKAAPTIGCIVGGQMVLQNILEKALIKKDKRESLPSILASSAIVGILSAPALAIFNGQTMGLSMRVTLQKFSARQGLAIALRETAFVGGISAANPLAVAMKQTLGESKVVDYTAAFATGALGSLAGHPADTALTRLQNGLPLESFRQLMWGVTRRAQAVGFFSVGYKCGKEILNYMVEKS